MDRLIRLDRQSLKRLREFFSLFFRFFSRFPRLPLVVHSHSVQIGLSNIQSLGKAYICLRTDMTLRYCNDMISFALNKIEIEKILAYLNRH